jgi:hypothetical protein
LKKTTAQLDREIAAIVQPRSRPGDGPELWSTPELEAEIRKYLQRGLHALASVRRFGGMMDELIDRLQAEGDRRSRTQLWERIVAICGGQDGTR